MYVGEGSEQPSYDRGHGALVQDLRHSDIEEVATTEELHDEGPARPSPVADAHVAEAVEAHDARPPPHRLQHGVLALYGQQLLYGGPGDHAHDFHGHGVRGRRVGLAGAPATYGAMHDRCGRSSYCIQLNVEVRKKPRARNGAQGFQQWLRIPRGQRCLRGATDELRVRPCGQLCSWCAGPVTGPKAHRCSRAALQRGRLPSPTLRNIIHCHPLRRLRASTHRGNTTTSA
mmetsp:Transcript_125662/g.355448  ORF Transcript_125662/g.355448 Transcript_125662/m.355448 type:complete len:230 (-) Transcript_125662:27-716(-)